MITEILPKFEAMEDIYLDSPDGYSINEDNLEEFLNIMDTLSVAINGLNKFDKLFLGFTWRSKNINNYKIRYIQLFNVNIKKNKKTINLRQEINNELKKLGFL
jgi:hypothetical protein